METSEIEKKLTVKCLSSYSQQANKKRLHNINVLRDFINHEIEEKNLKSGEKEADLLFHETSKGEKISIRFPGKETLPRGKDSKVYQQDFRPKIITRDGEELPDLTFEDMWSIMDCINENAKKYMKCISLIFFRMGRMMDYECKNEKMKLTCEGQEELVDLNLWRIHFDEECFKSLDSGIESIILFDKYKISYEAFIYFFELILQNEDGKYYDKKGNLSSGRTNTSDSMLLLASFFAGFTGISSLLHLFVRGKGIGKMTKEQMMKYLGNRIEIYDARDIILQYTNFEGVRHRKTFTKTIEKNTLRMVVKDDTQKIGYVNKINDKKTMTYEVFKKYGWEIVDLSAMEYGSLVEFLDSEYKNTNTKAE